MKNPEIKVALTSVSEHLTAAEKIAKELADNFPAHGAAQALRGRCKAALELCEAVVATPPVEVLEAPKEEIKKAGKVS